MNRERLERITPRMWSPYGRHTDHYQYMDSIWKPEHDDNDNHGLFASSCRSPRPPKMRFTSDLQQHKPAGDAPVPTDDHTEQKSGTTPVCTRTARQSWWRRLFCCCRRSLNKDGCREAPPPYGTV